MLRVWFGPVIIAGAVAAQSASAQPARCASIKTDAERLACYDRAASAPTKPAQSPLLATALAAVRKHLNDPASARFENVREKADGPARAVCGSVSAKNGMGGYAGSKLFVYDEAKRMAYVLVSEPMGSPASITQVGNINLGEGLKVHDRFCK